MQQPSSGERPLGVTILAILAAVWGILGLLGSLTALGFLAGGEFGLGGLIFLALSILYFVFAYGALTLQAWGWTLGVGLAVAGIVWALFSVTQGADIVSTLISVAISGVILYYLYQPDVKAAFGRT